MVEYFQSWTSPTEQFLHRQFSRITLLPNYTSTADFSLGKFSSMKTPNFSKGKVAKWGIVAGENCLEGAVYGTFFLNYFWELVTAIVHCVQNSLNRISDSCKVPIIESMFRTYILHYITKMI